MTTVLVVVPHPDDETYPFAGTIALARRCGWTVAVHCASSGERGKRHDGGPTSRQEVARTREAEFAASCAVLGAGRLSYWRMPDGAVRPTGDDVVRLAGVITGEKPRLLFTLGADGAYGHPDHLAVHRWVTEAWQRLEGARPALLYAAFPPGLFLPQWEKCLGMLGDAPHPPREAIGAAPWEYELPVGGSRAQKLEAVTAHRSQLPEGDPFALFPPGVLEGCLAFERFTLAEGSRAPDAFFAELAAQAAKLAVA